MNSNNTFYGYSTGHQSTNQHSAGFQVPPGSQTMSFGNGNYQDVVYSTNAFNHQIYPTTWESLPQFYPLQPNFGTAATALQGQCPMPPLPKIHRKTRIVGGMDWEAEIRINQTSYDSNGYWDATGFHLHQQGQTYQSHLLQQRQQPQPLHAHQALLPAAQAAPRAPHQQHNVCQSHQIAPQASSNAPSTSSATIDPLFNPTLPPFGNPSMIASQSTIKVALCNQELWKMLHKLGNEMAINNIGKELFPHLSYKVCGLNKRRQYKFVLCLERIDTFEFNWNRQLKQFERTNKKDKGGAVTKQISSKIQTGQVWENGNIDFADVNFHNIGKKEKIERATKNGPMTESQLKTAQKKSNKLTRPRICVSLNCKYIPVLAIYEVTNGICIHRGDFRFEETSFVVVSMYRNPVICAHKTALNTTNSKGKRANAEMKLKEYSGETSRPDSGFSTSSDSTPPPSASQYFGADGSLPSTSSGF